MSQAVPETVYIAGIDVLGMNIEVPCYLETVWTCDIDGMRMNIEVSWHLETVWTSAWLLELAYCC